MEHVLDTVLMCLERVSKRENTFQAFVGFDGFVDTLVKPVKTAGENGQMTFFDTIGEFGTYLAGKAGKSCSIELSKITEKMGGNTVIYASALSGLGIYTHCVGAFGYPQVKEIFKQNNPYLDFVTISDPGICTALEFSDGSREVMPLTGSRTPQRLQFAPKTVEWLVLKELIRAEGPSPFPALTQIEAWGVEADRA